jgi:hypothetical protein
MTTCADTCVGGACVTLPRFALSFDGSGDQVTFPSGIGSATTQYTVEAWVRPTTSTAGGAEGEGGILFFHHIACADTTLEWSGSGDGRTPGRFRVRAYHGTSGCAWVSPEQPVNATIGVWHHVAGVVDDGEVRLYVDGTLASATEPSMSSWSPGGAVLGNWAGRDGGDARPDRGAFIGEIDEIRLSHTARYSGSSITVPHHFVADAATMAVWLFDEGTGTSTSDGSGHGHDGTVASATWVPSSR